MTAAARGPGERAARAGVASAVEWAGAAAVAVALVFQNPYGELGPESDRFLLLQVLALVMVGLTVFAPASSWRVRMGSPLARAATVVALAGAVATVTAVDPVRSLLGAPPRLYGLTSELALVVLFLLLAPRLATVAARERFETAVLAAMGATVAYALVQWAGLDPLRWQVDWQGRPTAAQGNPLFLAQALVGLVPIAAGRAVARFETGGRIAAGAAAALAALAFAIVLRTGERGPLLGLAVAAVVFVALGCLSSREVRARRVGATLAGLLGIVLVAGAWFAWQRAESFTGTAKQRLLLWRAVVGLFEASPPSRLLVGFGAESLPIVLPPFLPPELPERIWRPDLYHDRAHNAVLDALASGGLLRLAAGLGLALAATLAALRFASVLRRRAQESGAAPERFRGAGFAAALAGLVVMGQFGVSTAATSVLCWLTLALLDGAQSGPEIRLGWVAPAPSGKRASEALRQARLRERLSGRLLAVMLLALVAFGAWVPAQREGDAMGGQVLLLLLLAAGGIALALASRAADPGFATASDVGLVPRGAGSAPMALSVLVVLAAVATVALVQLPLMASGVALKQGRTAFEAGRADLAVPLLQRSWRLAPAFEDPAVALARAEQRLAEGAIDPAQRTAGFGRAAAALAEARRRHPGLAGLALEEAHLAARRADGAATAEERSAQFATAVAAYRDVLARDPQSSTVHRGLGAALLALDRLDEAASELETSVRLAPRSLESRLLLGRLRLATGEEEAALGAFQAARAIDAPRARRLLEGLVRARPEDPSALRDLALFEIVEGHRKEAIAALQRAMALTAPQDLPPLVRLTGLAARLS
ncbi:MAG: O-antigen ligase family protein [Thermoanaerobaculia bacterium]